METKAIEPAKAVIGRRFAFLGRSWLASRRLDEVPGSGWIAFARPLVQLCGVHLNFFREYVGHRIATSRPSLLAGVLGDMWDGSGTASRRIGDVSTSGSSSRGLETCESACSPHWSQHPARRRTRSGNLSSRFAWGAQRAERRSRDSAGTGGTAA